VDTNPLKTGDPAGRIHPLGYNFPIFALMISMGYEHVSSIHPKGKQGAVHVSHATPVICDGKERERERDLHVLFSFSLVDTWIQYIRPPVIAAFFA
jgi:hypothetical protein